MAADEFRKRILAQMLKPMGFRRRCSLDSVAEPKRLLTLSPEDVLVAHTSMDHPRGCRHELPPFAG